MGEDGGKLCLGSPQNGVGEGKGRSGPPRTPNHGGVRGFGEPDPPRPIPAPPVLTGTVKSVSRGSPQEPGWAVVSVLSLYKSGGLGVPQPAKGATLRLQLPCRLCPALKKGGCAREGARRGLCVPPQVLTPAPQISSRLQLYPDGAAGGGWGGPAAPRRLRRALPPAAAAGFGEPQQAAVSGDPLKPPPELPRTPPPWGDAPRTYANKGCRDGAYEWRCWGAPALAPHSRGAQMGAPKMGSPGTSPLNGAAPLRGAEGGVEKGRGRTGRGPSGGAASNKAGGVA